MVQVQRRRDVKAFRQGVRHRTQVTRRKQPELPGTVHQNHWSLQPRRRSQHHFDALGIPDTE